MKTHVKAKEVAEKQQSQVSQQASAETIMQAYKDKSAQRQIAEEEELLQGKFETAQLQSIEEEELIQQKADPSSIPNNTGLPDNLKSGIENLSGYSMDDVKVHYNSSKPETLQAHAYAQGTDIHLAPGQEKHLPHEAWHVVQQKQGKVKPTMQLKGVNVNDDLGLEKEADVMGVEASKPMQLKRSKQVAQMNFWNLLKKGKSHFYKVNSTYGKLMPGFLRRNLSPEDLQQIIKNNAGYSAPGAKGPLTEGKQIQKLPGFGEIDQSFDGSRVTNDTREGHLFHEGRVTHDYDFNNFTRTTTGTGTGILPSLNSNLLMTNLLWRTQFPLRAELYKRAYLNWRASKTE